MDYISHGWLCVLQLNFNPASPVPAFSLISDPVDCYPQWIRCAFDGVGTIEIARGQIHRETTPVRAWKSKVLFIGITMTTMVGMMLMIYLRAKKVMRHLLQ